MKKRRKWRRSVISFMLASAMVLPGVGTAFAGGDTLPPREGEQGYKGEHQPSTHGYNRANILNWSPETDGYAEFMRSKVPLQERNEAFTATQANPLLDQEVESLSLMGDYGIGFFDSFSTTTNSPSIFLTSGNTLITMLPGMAWRQIRSPTICLPRETQKARENLNLAW